LPADTGIKVGCLTNM